VQPLWKKKSPKYLLISEKNRTFAAIMRQMHIRFRPLLLSLLAAITLTACTVSGGSSDDYNKEGFVPITPSTLWGTWHAKNFKSGEQWITADKAGYRVTLTFSGSTYQSQISKDGKIDPATGETDEGWLFTHSGSYEITGLYISCYETGNPRAVVHISVVNSTDRQIEATITESNAREALHVMLER
jgi:hypothetical protein